MNTTGYDSGLLHGLVLAGGDGRRLEPYIQELKGKKLPKQFVNFVGTATVAHAGFFTGAGIVLLALGGFLTFKGYAA